MMPNQVAYRIHANVDWVPASCEEVGCQHYLHGWQVRVEGLSPELLHTARTSGRKFTELPVSEGVTYLVFVAGQPCFQSSAHRKTQGHSPLYLVHNGERSYRHSGSDPWVDDLRSHEDSILGEINKG